MPIKEVQLIFDEAIRNLCFKPYPNHKKGCSNYGKKETCPPKVPLIQNVIDLSKPVYAIWTIFAFDLHVMAMKFLHPNWSQRQLECCLYWQGTARKKLKEEIFNFEFDPAVISYKVITCPEAMGVNITETMKSIGEILEWPPVTKTYQVAIAGVAK
jgi:predicted metal-binding protein